MEIVSTDKILAEIDDLVQARQPVDAHTWTGLCHTLNILKGDEDKKLYDLQQINSQLKIKFIDEGKSVAEAKSRVEATDNYKESKNQEAKIERIEEAIRIAKIQARLSDNNMRNG